MVRIPDLVPIWPHQVASVLTSDSAGEVRDVDGVECLPIPWVRQEPIDQGASGPDDRCKRPAARIRGQATFRLKAIGEIALGAVQSLVSLGIGGDPDIPTVRVQVTDSPESTDPVDVAPTLFRDVGARTEG